VRGLLTVLVAGGAIFAALPAVNSYADDGVTYDSPIANWNSLLCVSVPGASMATAVDLNQYPCGPNNSYNPVYPDQNWTLDEQSQSGSTYVFTIINDHSHLCMSVPGASTKPATVVNQYPCGYYADQYWVVSQVWDSAIGQLRVGDPQPAQRPVPVGARSQQGGHDRAQPVPVRPVPGPVLGHRRPGRHHHLTPSRVVVDRRL
jgi:hypothetical protein